MTVARASQVVAEVLWRNDAAKLQASQVAVEVLASNPGIIARLDQIAVEVLRPNLAEISTQRPVCFVVT